MGSYGRWQEDTEMALQRCDGEQQSVRDDHNYSKMICDEELEEVSSQSNIRTSTTDMMSIKRMELLFNFELNPHEDFFESLLPMKKRPPSAANLLKDVVIFLKSLYLQRSRKSICFETSDETSGVNSSQNNRLESETTKGPGKKLLC